VTEREIIDAMVADGRRWMKTQPRQPGKPTAGGAGDSARLGVVFRTGRLSDLEPSAEVEGLLGRAPK